MIEVTRLFAGAKLWFHNEAFTVMGVFCHQITLSENQWSISIQTDPGTFKSQVTSGTTISTLALLQVVVISLTVGIGLVTLLSRYLRRTKRSRSQQELNPDAAMLGRRLRSGIRSPNRGKQPISLTDTLCLMATISLTDILTEFRSASPVPLRAHRMRSTSVASDRYDRYSVSEAGDSKSTPQLLGTMGESLRLSLAPPRPLPLGQTL